MHVLPTAEIHPIIVPRGARGIGAVRESLPIPGSAALLGGGTTVLVDIGVGNILGERPLTISLCPLRGIKGGGLSFGDEANGPTHWPRGGRGPLHHQNSRGIGGVSSTGVIDANDLGGVGGLGRYRVAERGILVVDLPGEDEENEENGWWVGE